MIDEPVIVLTGPRTVGKTTLLRRLAHDHSTDVIDLDDTTTRRLVAQDLALFVAGQPSVMIDEFQHVPEVLDAIKAELNRDTRPGRFLLTGSTRYSTLPQTAQSLTGRDHRDIPRYLARR
jgi:predicted AAA+ superfamily ATPase